MNAVNITPETLFQRWLAAPYRPLLCEFNPTIADPVLKIQIGEIDGSPVYAYGALGRQSCAYWWEVWTLDRAEAVRRAWKYLPQQICREYRLMEELGTFLAEVAPKCPVCRASYARSEEWLQSLLTRGHAQITCGCDATGSELLHELRELLTSPLSRILPPGEWLNVVELMIGEVAMARMSLNTTTKRVTLSFSREAFRSARGRRTAAYVWPRTKAAILKHQEDECKAKSTRNELLRLRFYWNPGRLTWTAQSPLNERLTYVLPPNTSLKNEGWYYCQPLANQTGGSQWTVLVEAIHPVPVRHQSRLVPSSTKSLFRPR